MRTRDLNHQVTGGDRCCSFVMLAVPYDQRMGVARRREIGDSAAAPRRLEAIQGEVHRRSFKGVSGLVLSDQFIAVVLPLIEREEDVGYG